MINPIDFHLSPKLKITVNIDIKIIVEYSAKNKDPNINLLYSILNPETNSDSPSAKSNGGRFNSAKILIIHM